MAATGTVLRFRALYSSALLPGWLVALAVLAQLAAGASVASPAKAANAAADASYRSYHFVLLVKSYEGSNRTNASSDVSEELVIMPADANLLERSAGGAFELKPQPLPGHVTSALLKKYQTNRSLLKRAQLAPMAGQGKSHTAVPAAAPAVRLPKSSPEAAFQLHTVSRGNGKKQRYPKKATAVKASPSTTERTAGTTAAVKSSLRLLSLDDGDDGLAPFEVVATSKGSLPAQPRTVRKTATGDEATPAKPRYEVIGTFRDAHVSRTRTQRQSAAAAGR